MRQVEFNTHTLLKFGSSLIALTTAVAIAGCSGGGGSSSGGGGAPAGSVVAPPITANGGQQGNLTGLAVQPPGPLTVTGAIGDGFQVAVDGTYQATTGATGSASTWERDVTRQVTYSVDNPNVATISGDGYITPVAEGVATITIEMNSPSGMIGATKNVTVVAPPPTGSPDPTFTDMVIYPTHRTLANVDPEKGMEELQQLVVVGVDGSGRMYDLTRKIAVNIQDSTTSSAPSMMASASPTGLLRGFANGTVYAVARLSTAGIVRGSEFVLGTGVAKPVDPNTLYSGGALAGSTNGFDQAILANLFTQFIEPAKLAEDGEFIRRVYADAVGRVPTEAELAAFEANAAPNKRELVIDTLLASPEFSTRWASFLAESLAIQRNANGAAFETWAAGQIAGGASVADLFLAMADGSVAEFDAQHPMASDKVDILLLTGTGMTAQCAKCHDHPLVGPNDTPKWAQSERYPLDAFFGDATDATALDKTGARVGNPHQPAFVLTPTATVTSVLADPIAQKRAEFAQLFTQSTAFYRGMGHRIWTEVMQPLLDPNQFLAANLDAVVVPNVLATIQSTFAADTTFQGFLKAILTSKAYQLSSAYKDTQYDSLLARNVLRRHHAEVVDSAVDQVTGGTLAGADQDFFHQVFGYPFNRITNTERVGAINMSQNFALMNSPVVQDRVVDPAGAVATLAAAVNAGTITQTDAIRQIWRNALSRNPSAEEIDSSNITITGAGNLETGLQDVSASVMATIEFVMR